MTGTNHVEVSMEDLDLGECIGMGSYGQVYKADYRLRKVAVKFINEIKRKDFQSELEMLSSLSHPFLIGFYGACTQGKQPFLVLELAATALSNYIIENDYSLDQVYKWSLQIAEAMNFLHSKNIVHRDLKTSNILLDDKDDVKLCDFGSSRNMDMTLIAMTFAGTLAYMAPELLREQPSTKKIDCYSYGVVLWELLTKQAPFEGMQPLQIIWLVAAEGKRLPIPESAPATLHRLLEGCWVSEPEKRHSFQEVIVLLVQELKARKLTPDVESKTLSDYQTEWEQDIDNQIEKYFQVEVDFAAEKEKMQKKEEELRQREENVRKSEVAVILQKIGGGDLPGALRRFRSDPSPHKLRSHRIQMAKSKLSNIASRDDIENSEEES